MKVETATQTYATALQNYSHGNKLAGMTVLRRPKQVSSGTSTSDVVVIPTNRPIQRKDMNDKVYKTKREKNTMR